ncbi:hypothetical protein [Nocardia wallacei]|uniref:hypothetical protein n=1 Tax=Nocardia wallacei TaxID=480035 RepID=UPI002453C955|nr:hypothetical protein [Nocardia wallacei]
MKCPRPARRTRSSRPRRAALFAGLALLAAATAAGCDSRVGIEGTDYDTGTGSTSTSAAPSSTPPAGEVAVTVSLESPDPEAADALTRFAIDLQELPRPQLVDKCWTMAPRNVETMYADKQAVVRALAQPGVDDGTAITWQGPQVPGRAGITVVAQRADIATGYACPRVYPTGAETSYNDADARHTVRRYLARSTGRPLDPADREDTHPLICDAAWDPAGSGRTAAAPLSTNPGKLTGVRSFVDQSITSAPLRGNYLSVSAPVTTASGTQEQTFTLRLTDQGYCLGDVSG